MTTQKNHYLIENKKPFETFYELKNEIPSLEEFLDSYDYDENISNSYRLENQNQEKGYGPCHYSNADCTHYTSSGWVQLYLGCPAVECEEKGRNFSTWVHADCHYPIYISKYLEMKCISCDNPSHMLNWNFKCFSDNHKGGYRETNYEIFANALTLIGGKAKNRDPRIREIVKIISDKLCEICNFTEW